MKFLSFVTLLFLASINLPTAANASEESQDQVFEDAINRGHSVVEASPIAKSTVLLITGKEVKKNGKLYASIGFCSGTLIAKDIILTAAHCLVDENSKTVVVMAGILGKKVIEASSWKAHPNYDMRIRKELFGLVKQLKISNDIALVKLKQPFDESSMVAALPAANLLEDREYSLVPAGFGKPDGTEDSKPGTLRYGRSKGHLVSAHNGTKQHILMSSGTMTCQGDSGGPIFLNSNTGLKVVGVTSHGDRACETISVATSVGYYLKWIEAARATLQ